MSKPLTLDDIRAVVQEVIGSKATPNIQPRRRKHTQSKSSITNYNRDLIKNHLEGHMEESFIRVSPHYATIERLSLYH